MFLVCKRLLVTSYLGTVEFGGRFNEEVNRGGSGTDGNCPGIQLQHLRPRDDPLSAEGGTDGSDD